MFIKNNSQRDLILSSKKMYFCILIFLIILTCIFIIANFILHIMRYKVLQQKLVINDFFSFLDSLPSTKQSLNIKLLRADEIKSDYIPYIDMYATSLILLLPYVNICYSYYDLRSIIKELIKNKHIVLNNIIVSDYNLGIIVRHTIWKVLLYKSNTYIYNFFI